MDGRFNLLAIIDDILFEIHPEPVPVNTAEIRKHENHLTLVINGRPVESGVRWFSMSRTLAIHPVTGVYEGKGTARAVFLNQHLDLSLS